MNRASFANISACVFDAYGTLFDVHSAVQRGGQALGEQAQSVSALWRQKQLEYAWLSDAMGVHLDLWETTTRALDFALASFAINDAELRTRLLDLYMTLAAYPEARGAIAALRAAGMSTAILSNGSPKMVLAAVESAGLGSVFDAVWSVEKVGVHKPAPAAYEIAVTGLQVPAERICFVSSNGWDIAGAAHFGFAACWCNRLGLQEDKLPAGPDAEIASLKELPKLLGVAS
ncbi:MAG: haloacid dehalogenase type II [Pseudomonadota bacterium]